MKKFLIPCICALTFFLISTKAYSERDWASHPTHYNLTYHYGTNTAAESTCTEVVRRKYGNDTLVCAQGNWCQYLQNGMYQCATGWHQTSEIGPTGVQLFQYFRFQVRTDCQPNTDTGECESSPKNTPQSCPVEGNPVNPATGNKHQIEIDYASSGNSLLQFKRYYSSSSQFSLHLTPWSYHPTGSGWRFSYMRKVIEDIGGNDLTIVRDDGQQFEFTQTAGVWNSDMDVVYSIAKLFDLGMNHIGWEVVDMNDSIETYDVDGKLTSIESKGKTINLVYDLSIALGGDDDSTTLDTVTDHAGRVISLKYALIKGKPTLDKMIDPEGNEYLYEYEVPFKTLISITYPDDTPLDSTDNPTKEYLYENFNLPNFLTGIIDENNERYATWSYDTMGRAISSEHANGAEKFTFTYNTNGTTTVTDLLGSSRIYTFIDQYDVTKTSSVSGDQCNYCGGQDQAITYDANGFVASRTDFEGNITTYVNNAQGLQTSRTEASGTLDARTITTDWHGTLRLPIKITESGKETTFTYNSDGLMLTRTETDTVTFDSSTTTYTYDLDGNVLTIDGPRTNIDDVITYTYSSGNRATMSIDPDGAGSAPPQVTNFTSYDNSGRLLSMTDPNGVVTTMAYDARGRLITRTLAVGTSAEAINSFEYDVAGNLIKITLPNNQALSYSYDAANRLTRITDSQNNYIEYTLDNHGNRTKEDIVDEFGNLKRRQTRVFDQLSQLIQTVGGESQLTIYGYDYNGNQTSVLDPLSRTTTSAYDALDRLITQTDANSNNTTYDYDAHDNLTSVTDPRGLVTTYTYDGLDNLTQLTSPDTGITTYTYDDAGNRLTQTDARGITATYTYDALNRVTTISYPDTSLNVTYTYDQGSHGIGRLTSVTDSSGTTDYTYDERGNLLTESKLISGMSYLMSYSYNLDNTLSSITYPSGRVAEYFYNSISQINQVTTTYSGNTDIVAANINYLPFGPVLNFTLGNGLAITNTYDQDYRITDILSPAIMDLGMTYDAANNISVITDGLDNTRDQSFTYDSLDRLTDADGIYGVHDYTYDANGNRLTETVDLITDTYTYHTTSNQINDINLNAYTLDLAGNVTNDTSNLYSYSDANRMATMLGGSGSATYTYNAKGERTIKTTGTATTVYHFDQSGNLIAETDVLGNTQVEYIYLNGQRLAMIDPTTTGPSGTTEIIVDNTDSAASSLGNWSTTITGTGDYEGANVSALDNIAEIIIDNLDAEASFTGTWTQSNPGTLHWASYNHYKWNGSNNRTFTFDLSSIPTGQFKLYAWWKERHTRATNTPFTITHDGGDTILNVNQQIDGSQWNLLDTFNFTESSGHKVVISDNANGQVVADAIRLVPAQQYSFTWDAPIGSFDVYAKWTEDSSHISDATYTLHHNSGSTTVTANQQSGGTGWNLLGTATFDVNGKVELNATSAGTLIADSIRFVDTSISTTALYYYHTNHLDTPQVMTDNAQTVVWKADYEPFGKANISVNTIENNLRFPGQYYDSETGNHYNYFRDYNPLTGRYVQSDPIGLEGGVNTYGYANINPLKYIDPNGLQPRPCHPSLGFPPGTICDDGIDNDKLKPKCQTSFCAADIPGAEPNDTRTQEEIECGQCQLVCNMATLPFAPGKFIPKTIKELLGTASSNAATGEICEFICSN